MKKFIVLGAALILLGAGCSSAGTTNLPSDNQAVDQQATTNQNQQSNTIQSSTQSQNDDSVTKNSNPTQTNNIKSFTMAEVAQNNSAAKCWIVVNRNVYDVTNFINKHPGGPEKVLRLCGTDGTSAFTQKHGGQEKPEATLASLKIGVLK